MSAHAQFIALAIAGLALTMPVIAGAWIVRLPCRRLASALYVSGFALIGATLILDPILSPPLFFHGFFPGIGIGGIAIALALTLIDWRTVRQRR